MILHTDIPTHAQVSRMLDVRNRASVSIYVSTDPVSANVGERIELGNLAAEAMTSWTMPLSRSGSARPSSRSSGT